MLVKRAPDEDRDRRGMTAVTRSYSTHFSYSVDISQLPNEGRYKLQPIFLNALFYWNLLFHLNFIKTVTIGSDNDSVSRTGDTPLSEQMLAYYTGLDNQFYCVLYVTYPPSTVYTYYTR